MATVGGVTVSVLRGPAIPDMAESVTEVTRPGANGVVVVQRGLKPTPFRKTVTHFAASNAAANTFIAAIQALQGTIVTIVDEHGDSHANCEIQLAALLRKRKVVAGAGEYAVTFELQCLRVGA